MRYKTVTIDYVRLFHFSPAALLPIALILLTAPKLFSAEDGHNSATALTASNVENHRHLQRLEETHTTGRSTQEQLDRQLLAYNLRQNIQSFDLKLHEIPIDQFSGFQLQVSNFIPSIPFNTIKDYEDYLARPRAYSRSCDQVILGQRSNTWITAQKPGTR